MSAFAAQLDHRVSSFESYLEEYDSNPDGFLNNNPRAPGIKKPIQTSFGICKVITPNSTGTGFLVKNNIVVTNAHVIKNATPNQIKLAFGYYTTNSNHYLEKTLSSTGIEMNALAKEYLANGGDPDYLHPSLDWAVLTLATPFNTSDAKARVLKVNAGTIKSLFLDRPYILHHGAGSPMKISYVENRNDLQLSEKVEINSYSYLFPNCVIGIEEGASGAPFIAQTGEVIGIVSFQYFYSNCLQSNESSVPENPMALQWVLPFNVLLDKTYGSTQIKNAFGQPSGITVINGTLTAYMAGKKHPASNTSENTPFIASLNWGTGILTFSFGSSDKTIAGNASASDCIDAVWNETIGYKTYGQDLANVPIIISEKQAVAMSNLVTDNGPGKYKIKLDVSGFLEANGVPDINTYMPPDINITCWLADKNLNKIRDLISFGSTYSTMPALSYKTTKEFECNVYENQTVNDLYFVFQLENECYVDKKFASSEWVDVQICQKAGVKSTMTGWSPLNGWIKPANITFAAGTYSIILDKAVYNSNFSYFSIKKATYYRLENSTYTSMTENLGNEHSHCSNTEWLQMKVEYLENRNENNCIIEVKEKYQHGTHFRDDSYWGWIFTPGPFPWYFEVWSNTNSPCRTYDIKYVELDFDVHMSNGDVTSHSLSFFLPYAPPVIVTFNENRNLIFANNNQVVSVAVSALGNFKSFRWYRNSQLLQGEKESTLKITNTDKANDGDLYSVVVTNAKGSVASNQITLKISDPAYISNEVIQNRRLTISTGLDKYFPTMFRLTSITYFSIDWGDGSARTTGSFDAKKDCRIVNGCFWSDYMHVYARPGRYLINVYYDNKTDPVSKNLIDIKKSDITPIINLLLGD